MRSEVKHFLDKYINRIKELDMDINSIVLFGSQARETATISSDIDIAVITDKDLPHRDRGQLLCLNDEIDMRFEVNLFFTTKSNLENACGDFDTNKYIKKEGIVLWRP